MNALAWIAPLALAGLSHALSAEDPPPIFAVLTYEEAVAKTKASELVLVVKATASWCPPCKRMDQTTWRDAGVVDWFQKNGIAIQFDVDRERDLAMKLGIQAMPTMIAYVKGAEFDRVVGYKSAAEMLAWVGGVKTGKRAIEATKNRAAEAKPGSKEEVDAKLELAKDQVRASKLDEATETYAWVWEHSVDVPGYGGVRGSFLAREMERLAARHPAAKARFAKLRDELGPKLQGEKVDADVLDDWIVLNGVVGESSKTLAWFDEVRADARWATLIGHVDFRLERLLIEANRWADVAVLYPDPLAAVRDAHESKNMATKVLVKETDDEQERQKTQELHDRMFRDDVGKVYASMLAADREEEGAKVVKLALELDDTPGMRTTLVWWALEARAPRDGHTQLVDEAERAGADVKQLRKKLENARAPAGAR